MVRNYIKIAIRSLMKDGMYSLIKIGGLAIGIAAALVITLFVKEDLAYDTMHAKYDRIMRIITIDSAEGVESKLVGVSQPALGPALKAEIPEVEEVARISNQGKMTLSYNDNPLKAEKGILAESDFFKVFDFKILKGKTEGPLNEPGSIVITEKLANRIFGSEDPLGKVVMLDQTTPLHVTAVMEDPSPYSHLQFDLLRSMKAPEGDADWQQYLESWSGISMNTYLLLDKPTSPEELNPKLKEIAQKNNAYEFFTPTAQKLSDVHLKSKNILFESNANKSDISNVYVLSTIALLIILLAAVNFMNLVTAKSAGRAKEVGLRKVVGAERNQIVFQYLFESIIITIVSASIALTMVFFALPVFNNIYQRAGDFEMIFQPGLFVPLLIFIILVGIVSGIYPALVLSAFKPVSVLKGAFKNSSGGIRLRKFLVVLQFTISIALIIGTGIVYQQMDFINNKELGYNREQLITIPLSGENVINKGRVLRSEILRNESVLSAATSNSQLGQQPGRTNIYPEGEGDDANYITSVMAADEEYIPTMEMDLLAGRNFSLDFPSDSANAMIINEALAKMLKWEDPIGKTIRLSDGSEEFNTYTVVGMLKNFHFNTIRHKVEPMFMLYGRNNNVLSVKLKTDDINESLAFIEAKWKEVIPNSPYEYSFLDDQFDTLYKSEKSFASMFSHFTFLALLIAVLGLFALSAFTAEQKRKEIGIRKILGADTSNLVYLLSIDFMKLVLVSFVLAAPLAYYFMNGWLQEFSYRIEVGWAIFAIGGLSALAVAGATVSFQAIKAALANPIGTLRSE